MVSDRCIDLVKRFEGFSSKPYICPAGYLTIGYGHLIQKGESFTSLTKPEAEKLLIKDIKVYEAWVARLCPVELTQGQFDALVSFCYNLGPHRLKISTLRKRVNDGLHWLVPNEFLKWKYAGKAVLKGLLLRRQAQVELYVGN